MSIDIDQVDMNPDFPEMPRVIPLSGVKFEGRQEILNMLMTGMPVKFERDPFNLYDRNAIKVIIELDNKETQIGWVPKEWAEILAPEIDNGVDWFGEVNEVVGGGDLTKGVRVEIYHSRKVTSHNV